MHSSFDVGNNRICILTLESKLGCRAARQDLSADLLRLGVEVWRHGSVGRQASEGVGGRDRKLKKLLAGQVVDNGTVVMSNDMLAWQNVRGGGRHDIIPAKPMKITFIKSFNCRLRHELRKEMPFRRLCQACLLVAAWQADHNQECPHMSLGGNIPNGFATRSPDDHNQNGRRF